MASTLSFYPVGNGDMTLVDLESARHVLCDDAKALNAEARRRVRKFRDSAGPIGDGDRILIHGERLFVGAPRR